MVVCLECVGRVYSTFSLQLHGPSTGHRFSMLPKKHSKMLQSVVLAAVLWQHPDLPQAALIHILNRIRARTEKG